MVQLRHALVVLLACLVAAAAPAPAPAQSQKLVLDGRLDYAEAADDPALRVSGQSFTLEVWVKHDGESAPGALIVDKTDGSATTGGYELALDGGGEEPRVRVDLPATFNTLTSTAGIPADRWTHVAVVYDGNQISLYLNGELDASTSAGGSIDGNSLPLMVGTKTSAANEKFFSGEIDELRLWSTTRSLLQLRENRFSQLAGSETGLQAYYPFPSGSPATDRAGGNDLALRGDAAGAARDVFPVPPDLYVQKEGAGQVRLVWDPRGATQPTGFRLYRSPPTGLSGRSEIARPGGAQSTYTAAGLSNGKTYFWEVAAVDAEGNEGDYSPLMSGTPYDGSEPSPLKGGASLALDGAADYGTVSDRPSLDIFDNTMTLELWVKHDGESDPDALIVDKTDGSATTGGYELALDGGGEEPRVRVDLPATFNTLISTAGIPADRWTHVAVVYDGNQISLYLNGELDASTSAGGSIDGNGLPMKIGTITSASNEKFFSGRIDELRLWGTARTESEVQGSFREEVGGREAGLKAYWRFNGAGKGVLQDRAIGYGTAKSSILLAGDAAIGGPGALPLAPVVYARAFDARADLGWAERKDGEASQFTVYRAPSADGSGRSSLASLAAADTAYTDPGPSNGTNTFYEVTATTAAGQESDYAHPAPVTPSTRPFGNALLLDGSQDYGTVGDRPSLDVFDNTMTLEAWVRHDGTSTADAMIVDKATGASTDGGYEMGLVGSGSAVPVYVDLPGPRAELQSSTTLAAGAWTHVAVTYDGNQVSLYVDGLLEAQTGVGGGPVGGNALPLKVGTKTSASNDLFFSGQVDELRLWTDARTQAELLRAARRELTGNEPGLAAYWRFNEAPGTGVARAAAERPKTARLSGDADLGLSAIQPAGAVVGRSVSSDGGVDFDSTGVDIAFSGTSGSGDVVVEKFDAPPEAPSGIDEANVSRYRYLLRSGGDLALGAGTEVRFDVGTLEGVSDAGTVVVYKRETPGAGDFTPVSTTYDADNGELVATTDSFSEFVLASDDNGLPVELAGFEAGLNDDAAVLRWRTASENGNAGFAVERRAYTGDAGTPAGWTRVGFVGSKAAGGTTAEARRYRFTDAGLPFEADSVQYRLRQVDVDGAASFSAPVTVRRPVDRVRLLGTAPNPVRRSARVRYMLPDGTEARLELYDVLGRRVRSLRAAGSGRAEAVLDVDGLTAGVYFLRLTAGDRVRTRRLTVVP
jgi:hypothetical protein